MKIAVAGTGYVGLTAGVCFAEKGHQVICVDIDEAKVKMLKGGIPTIYEEGLRELMVKNYSLGRIEYTTNYKSAYKDAEVIFIGVGTPEKEDGSVELMYVYDAALQIAESVQRDCLVVLKSTVPVGTNDKVEELINTNLMHDVIIEVASNPEFLAQGTAVKNTMYPSRIVIGTESTNAERVLKELYKDFDAPIVSVNRRSAEMIKYASNNFLALKISYMNDIANLCELVGADVKEVASGMSFDTRIGKDFLNAGIGYGGSCFPKDTKALKYLADVYGYHLQTVEAAVNVNNEQKLRLMKKAKERFVSFNDLKVAVLGLTFKPGTDDIREAPAVVNVTYLLEAGAEVRVYDPVGMDKFKMLFKDRVVYASCVNETLKDADICFIFTEWNEFKQINVSDFKVLMKQPIVYDGRNVFDLSVMEKEQIEYYSIGRKDIKRVDN